MKIYDTFIFFNELDLLDLRLKILDNVVDYFIISEFNITHSGLKKEYIFEKNKDLFKKYSDKIIYIKHDLEFEDFNDIKFIDNPKNFKEKETNKVLTFFKNATHFPKNEKNWCRDFLHREMLRVGYGKCNDEDIILMSDIDEIPNPKVIENLNKFFNKDKIYRLLQNMYYYYFNVFKENNWKGTTLTSYKTIKNVCLNDTRNFKWDSLVDRGGWHFSFMGGKEAVKEKIISYSHQEINRDDIKDNLDDTVDNLQDIFGRQGSLKKVEIDNTYPEYIINNKDKLDKFIL